MSRRSFYWPAWMLFASLLVGVLVEFVTPRTIQLSGFLLIPVLASAVLGRPRLTAALAVSSLALAVPVQLWLDFYRPQVAVRSVLIGTGGILAVALAANLARVQRARAASEKRYRRSMDNAAVGMCLVTPQGRTEDVNAAMGRMFGYDPEAMTGMHWKDFTAPEYLEEEQKKWDGILEGRIDSYRMVKDYQLPDGRVIWGDVSVSGIRDDDGYLEYAVVLITDITARVEAEKSQAEADARFRRLMETSGVGMCLSTLEGRFQVVNEALCKFLGYDTETLCAKTWQDVTPADFLDADLKNTQDLVAGRLDTYRVAKQFLHADGHRVWGQLSASCLRDAKGNFELFVAQIVDITDEVAARVEAEEARRQQALVDSRYRRSMDNAAVGMCLVSTQGRTEDINAAMCHFFGDTADALTGVHWQDVTAPEYLEEEQRNWDAVVEGRIDSYRMVKHFRRADGKIIWGDVAVSGIRDDSGRLEYFVALITDITARVEADERNRLLARELAEQNERTKAELDSAAAYMSAIMPRELQGPVAVSSRYLPSRELGGDCFDYHWVDDDHLVFYLIDVSGHGLEPALLAVSLQNMLRGGSFPATILVNPEAALTELNRLFQMEDQNGHYFTSWYGVYQSSTRTLRYANAGAPPPFLIHSSAEGVLATKLGVTSMPVGIFDDTRFTAASCSVSPGSQILVYSDGAFEVVFNDGGLLTVEGLEEHVTHLAASPDWSLDELIDRLHSLTPSGIFEDDCSLVLLTVD